MTRWSRSRVGAVVAVLALGAGLTPLAGGAATAAPTPPTTPTAGTGQATSTTETPVAKAAAAAAAGVDAVRTPKLHWKRCHGSMQCATVKVPLDYDRPTGRTVELGLLRVKARDSKHRIGSLFVNPGGPGASATELAQEARYIFSKTVRDRFDIVGMDPRGIGESEHVKCLTSKAQAGTDVGYAPAFPIGADQEKAWTDADHVLGAGCSNDRLAKSMSTAEVARDMELMRRAVGDKKLTYLGFSYGTYLGQVYASMFPDRFRAVAVDGVLDPVAWAGTPSHAAQPLEARLDSASGAWKALHEILVRCDRAGGTKCQFAPGDPVANLALIAERLRAQPLVFSDDDPEDTFTLTYADMVSILLGELYDPAGYDAVASLLADLYVLTEPPNPDARTTDAQRSRARARVAELHHRAGADGGRPGWAYDNSTDAFVAVTCTDSTETTTSAQFHAFAIAADQKAPYFGRSWLWNSSVCSPDAFPGEDEDAYTGPFDVATAAPVLYVGDYYDPATNYAGAVSASNRMPNSRLLSSDSFGHTAYGTSSCTTDAVDAYLIKGTLPPEGKVCVGDVQPFESDADDLAANARRQQALGRYLTGSAAGVR